MEFTGSPDDFVKAPDLTPQLITEEMAPPVPLSDISPALPREPTAADLWQRVTMLEARLRVVEGWISGERQRRLYEGDY